MDKKEYLEMLADELASEFTAIGRLTKFTKNPTIIGAHAEAAVRQFVKRTVSPLRVSTGAIVYEDNTGTPDKGKPRQIDTLVWSPVLGPAIFECGEFALVTRGNCHIALEIKRSMYSETGKKARDILDQEEHLFHFWAKQYAANGRSVMQLQDKQDGAMPNMLAVFCVEGDSPDADAKRLLRERRNGNRRALLLLKGGQYEPNHEDILEFVNVLLRARFLGMQTSVFQQINTSLLEPGG